MTPEQVLEKMLKTKKEKAEEYVEDWDITPNIIKAIWPNGVHPRLLAAREFHLVLMIITKLGRFISSDMKHVDSIHDIGVYSAIIESFLLTELENRSNRGG